jgi:rRNA maturation RNase YbeY
MQKQETIRIRFNYLDRRFYFPHRTELKRFLLRLFKNEGVDVGTVNYIFCSDRHLLGINQTHLNHDTLTDIITFQYSQPGQPVTSDIYISIDRVKENARIFQVEFSNELYRVMFHGALHLCGYKDKSKTDIQDMRAAENKYLTKYKG